MNQFKDILTARLKALNLSQTEAALQLNMERKTFNGYVTGRTEPSIEMLGKIARAFNLGKEIYEMMMEQKVPHETKEVNTDYKEKYYSQLEKSDQLRDKIDDFSSDLKECQSLLQSLFVSDIAYRQEMSNSMDALQNKKKGTIAAAAGKLEIKIWDEFQKTGIQALIGRLRNRAS